MKIQGTHPSINTYRQLQQQHKTQKNTPQKDKLNISDTAKKMQKSDINDMKRAGYVKDIKNQVQSGEYKIEPEKMAKKIVDFWS